MILSQCGSVGVWQGSLGRSHGVRWARARVVPCLKGKGSARDEVPDGCRVRLAFKAEGKILPWHVRGGGHVRGGRPSIMLTIATLMYADDLVVKSCHRSGLS